MKARRACSLAAKQAASFGATGAPRVRSRTQYREKRIEKYLSSVVSFSNAITATGIVIHHTAVIPGENTVPQSGRDIDKYHQARGFKILCFGRIYHVVYHYLIMPNGSVQPGKPETCGGYVPRDIGDT